MEELKVQNDLLMQLVKTLQNQINSKNRQNQILFQQYEQLAEDNQMFQTELEGHRSQIRELKKGSYSSRQSQDSRISQINRKTESQVKELRRRLVEDTDTIQILQTELKQKTNLVVELQGNLQAIKVQLSEVQKQAKLVSSLNQHNKKLQRVVQMNSQQKNTLTDQINSMTEKLKDNTRERQQYMTLYGANLAQKQDIIRSLAEKVEELRENSTKRVVIPAGTQKYKERIQQLQANLQEKESIVGKLYERITILSKNGATQEEQVIIDELNLKIVLYQSQINELKRAVAIKDQTITQFSQFLQHSSAKNRQIEEKLQLTNNLYSPTDQNDITSKQEQNQRVQQLEIIIKTKDSSIAELTEHLELLFDQVNTLNEEVFQLKALQSSAPINRVSKQQQNVSQIDNNQKQFESMQNAILQIHTALSTKEDQLAHMHQMIRDKDQAYFSLTQIIEKQAQQLKKREFNANFTHGERVETEDSERIKQTIRELQEIIAMNQSTIQQLKDMVEEQKQRIEELEAVLSRIGAEDVSQSQDAQGNGSNQRIEELQNIIKTKDQNIAALTEYLEQQYPKITILEHQQQKTLFQLSNCKQQLQKLKKSKSSSPITSQKLQQRQLYQNKDHELKTRLQEKEKLLSEIEIVIEQKYKEVDKIKTQLKEKEKRKKEQQNEMEEKQKLLDQVSKSIYQIEKEAQHMESQRQTLKKQNQRLGVVVQQKQTVVALLQSKIKSHEQQIIKMETIESNYQHQFHQLQQQKRRIEFTVMRQQSVKQNGQQNQLQIFQAQKEEQMAALMDVMDSLQEQIRSKGQIIDEMTEQIEQFKSNGNKQPKYSQPNDHQLKRQLSQKRAQCTLKEQQLHQLQQQNVSLREKLAEMDERLNQQQQHSQLQEQYDMIEMEQEIIHNTQKMANRYKKELEQIKQQSPEDISENQEGEQNSNHQEEQLTATQALEQLLIYSEEGQDIESIRLLISNLRSLYGKQLQSLQLQNNDLKGKATELIQINDSLQSQIERLSQEIQEKQTIIQHKSNIIDELERNIKEIEDRFSRQIYQLRSSIFDQSPISVAQKLQTSVHQDGIKEQKEKDIQVIHQLKQEMAKIKKENKLKDEELAKLRPNFAKELNDLLADSCINNQEDKQILQKVTAERDQMISKCHDYEEQIKHIEQKYILLSNTLQNNANHQRKKSNIQENNLGPLQSIVYRKKEGQLTDRPYQKAAVAQNRHSRSYEHHAQDPHFQKHPFEYEELQFSLGQKNEIIAELEGTILQIEKGFNAETMSLRRNIAQLNNQIIGLRKKLYQSNPNAIDITQFVKGTFAQQRNTEFFRYQFPKYSQSYFSSFPQVNQSQSSYNIDNRRDKGRMKTESQPYTNEDLNLGEKIIGRKCRGNPFPNSPGVVGDFNTNSIRVGDNSGWQSRVPP